MALFDLLAKTLMMLFDSGFGEAQARVLLCVSSLGGVFCAPVGIQ